MPAGGGVGVCLPGLVCTASQQGLFTPSHFARPLQRFDGNSKRKTDGESIMRL